MGIDLYIIGCNNRISTAGIQVECDSPPIELPKMLGRFENQGVLGPGGFGRVFLGYDPLLKRSVAIKAPKRTAFGT